MYCKRMRLPLQVRLPGDAPRFLSEPPPHCELPRLLGGERGLRVHCHGVLRGGGCRRPSAAGPGAAVLGGAVNQVVCANTAGAAVLA